MAANWLSLLVLEADVAGIDAVLVERFGAGRMVGQQLVADVMEIADQRHVDAALAQAVADMRHRGGGLVAIDRDADHLRAGTRQCCDLVRPSPSTSAVSVLVIDCTTTGAPPPTATLPTITCVVVCRGLGPATSISDGLSNLFMGLKYQVFVTSSNGSMESERAVSSQGRHC